MAKRKASLTLPNLFSPRGRTGRVEFSLAFWLSLIFLFLVFFALAVLPDMVSDDTMDLIDGPVLWVVMVVMVFIYYILFCILGQRLHDVNLSAWWGLILFSGVILAAIVPSVVDSLVARGMLEVGETFARILGLIINLGRIGYGLATLLGVFLSFWPGNPGDNRYGPDPREDMPALDAPEA